LGSGFSLQISVNGIRGGGALQILGLSAGLQWNEDRLKVLRRINRSLSHTTYDEANEANNPE